MNNQMNDYIALLRSDALKMFPGAVSVSIFINEEGVIVTPSFRGQLNGVSMKTIDGDWCTKRTVEKEADNGE